MECDAESRSSIAAPYAPRLAKSRRGGGGDDLGHSSQARGTEEKSVRSLVADLVVITTDFRR